MTLLEHMRMDPTIMPSLAAIILVAVIFSYHHSHILISMNILKEPLNSFILLSMLHMTFSILLSQLFCLLVMILVISS